ncbi:MAG: type III-A CRISPR-associated RAMP protein Csm3 [Saprospiraceae bacterium]|nr:type III-A CRISPR-associated RAMP protein Csm3 [Saprospiraceae bacterium]
MANSKGAEFVGNFILRGKFECLTGLHIGGSKEKLDIGGVDSPVIRNPKDRMPYVPGSSLKGKLRSLLEYGLGVVPIGKNEKGKDITGNVSSDAKIVRIFGIGANEKDPDSDDFIKDLRDIGPSRLVVRDSHPDKHTQAWWDKLDTELQFTEIKSENGINRITSAANPRFIERVAAGSRFEFEMVYSVFKISESDETALDAANADLDNLRMALLMLEHNFIGKSGSRGYGRIQFHLTDPVWVSNADYRNGGKNFDAAFAPLPAEVDGLKRLGEVQFEIPKAASN